jgi:hypothetical protein
VDRILTFLWTSRGTDNGFHIRWDSTFPLSRGHYPDVRCNRRIQYHAVWCRSERTDENLGAIHARLRGNIWVSKTLKGQFGAGSRLIRAWGASFFMSIGSVIRTEGSSPALTEAYARARRYPIVMPRQQMGRLEETPQNQRRWSLR